ncbi:MAG: hypothetical protein LBR56_06030 [Sporomusaceae bacterium]|jgi:hypothetical protein|nr:hypothetical protein [Sporomusaceae bacterium]
MRLSLDKWIKRYEEKTKDKFETPAGFTLYYLPERGFAQFAVDPTTKSLIIYQLCGDALFWHDLGIIMCQQQGLHNLCSICTRNIKPYIRLFGWKIIKEEEIEGMKRFYCLAADGGNVLITYAWLNEDTGAPNYYVTQEVKAIG